VSDIPQPDSDQSSAADLRIVSAAVLTGLALLVPIPFLDDMIATRARRHLIQSLLQDSRAGTSGLSLRAIAVVYQGQGGCLSGCLGFFVGLITKPIIKLFTTIFFVLAIRSAILSVAETLMLGRCFRRSLERGDWSPPLGLPAQSQRAKYFRQAFDKAFAGLDRRLLRHAFVVGFDFSKKVLIDGARASRAIFDQRRASPDEAQSSERKAGLDADARDALLSIQDAVAQALQSEAWQKLLRELDAAFDADFRPGPELV
jgi:hypothetical protein